MWVVAMLEVFAVGYLLDGIFRLVERHLKKR